MLPYLRLNFRELPAEFLNFSFYCCGIYFRFLLGCVDREFEEKV